MKLHISKKILQVSSTSSEKFISQNVLLKTPLQKSSCRRLITISCFVYVYVYPATTRMRRLRFFLVIVFHIFVLSLLTETGILKKTNTHAQLVFVLSLLTEIGILKKLTRMRS